MKLRKQTPRHPGNADYYAQIEDFCRLFMQESRGLHLLAVLLTRSHERAEQCLLAALDDCLHARHVYRTLTQPWAKRTILHHAIRMVMPRADNSLPQSTQATVHLAEFSGMSELRPELGCVLQLGDLERFVFVMTVLEGYRPYECALLLDCSLESVRRAGLRALRQLATLRLERITAHSSSPSTSSPIGMGSQA
jgi:DNA-directed RNA polymerase specialized sigma24 family protein